MARTVFAFLTGAVSIAFKRPASRSSKGKYRSSRSCWSRQCFSIDTAGNELPFRCISLPIAFAFHLDCSSQPAVDGDDRIHRSGFFLGTKHVGVIEGRCDATAENDEEEHGKDDKSRESCPHGHH